MRLDRSSTVVGTVAWKNGGECYSGEVGKFLSNENIDVLDVSVLSWLPSRKSTTLVKVSKKKTQSDVERSDKCGLA